LEDDRLGPPIAEVSKATEARRRRRDQQEAADREDDELDDVEQVDGLRRTEAVDGPILCQGLDPREVRLRLPLVEIKRRRCGGQEADAKFYSLSAPPSLTARPIAERMRL
jgi:hypothetical protein